MDAFDEMRVAQQGDEPYISPSELNAELGSDPWEIFLNARANVIDFLSLKHSNKEIADILSMDTIQVRSIKERPRTLNDGA